MNNFIVLCIMDISRFSGQGLWIKDHRLLAEPVDFCMGSPLVREFLSLENTLLIVETRAGLSFWASLSKQRSFTVLSDEGLFRVLTRKSC